MHPALASLVERLDRPVVVRDGAGRELLRNAAAADVTDTRGWERLLFDDVVVLIGPSRHEHAEQRYRILSEASRVLSVEFPDPVAAMQAVADLAVRAYCVFSLVQFVGPDDARRTLQAHRDPRLRDRLARARELATAPIPLVERARRRRQPVRVERVRDRHLVAAASGPEHLELLRALAPRSLIVAPLLVRGEAVGVLAFARTEEMAPFDAEDEHLAADLANRAAQALDNARLLHEARRSESRLRQIIDADLLGVVTWKTHGPILSANRRFLSMLGYDRIGPELDLRALTPPGYRSLDEDAAAMLRDTGRHPPYEKALRHRDGHAIPVLVASTVFPDSPDEALALVLDLTPQKRVEERLRVLADASEILHTIVDEREAADRLVQLLVPRLADGCLLDLVRDGRVERAAVAHRDPDRIQSLWEAANRWPVHDPQQLGQAELIVAPTEADLRRYATSPEHEEALKAAGFSSAALAPLLLDGRVLGRLAIYSVTDRPPLEQGDLQLMIDLARRLALTLERNRLTRDLQQSESVFRTVVEATPQLTFAADTTGALTFVNHRWSEYTGRSLEVVREGGWQAFLHPDDLPAVTQSWTSEPAIAEGIDLQVRLRGDEGRWRWFLLRALATRDRSGRVRWLGTCTDIDEAKRRQDRDRLIATASAALTDPAQPDAALARLATMAVSTDFADLCVIYLCDERGCRLAHLHHRDPALGRRAWNALQRAPLPEDAPHGWPRVVRTGESDLIGPIEAARTPGQRPFPELDVVSALHAPMKAEGELLGVVGVASTSLRHVYDDGDRRVAEEVGRRAALYLQNARLYAVAQSERTRAEEANRLKDAFLAMLSHELRTPLSALAGWTQLLRRHRVPPERIQHAIEVIDRNARTLAQLIDDLLDVSRIVTGDLRITPRPISLDALLDEALDPVRATAAQKGVTLDVDLRPVPEITGDPERLQQVVWNLVSNAVKFTPPDGRVTVSLGAEDGEIVVRVTDTGVGIHPDFLPHLFDPFRQADSSSTRIHGGLGLGLAISKHLVEAHGGTIRAESAGPGHGATFTIRLPVAPSVPAPPPPATVPAGRLDGVHVLVVEDDDDTRELLVTLLELSGARVTSADSAAEARDALARERPDVIVSDIGMPEEDGLSLIRSIRRRPPQDGGSIPAIALTAFATALDRQRALQAGFQAHAPKPLDPDQLVELIRATHRSAPTG